MKTIEGVFLPVIFMAMVLVLMPLSQNAVAAKPVFGSAAESKYAREFSPPKGKAVIYIYQRKGDGKDVSPTVKLNNYLIGRLVPGSFAVWKMSPGQVTIQVDGVKSVGYSFKTKPGKTYRFRLVVERTAAGDEVKLELMSASARNDIVGTRLLKNPKTVTTYTKRNQAIAAAPKPSSTPKHSSKARSRTSTVKQKSKQDPAPDQSGQFDYEGGQLSDNLGLMLKVGAMSLSSSTQFIVGADRSFDKSTSLPYGVDIYYRFSSGLTVGGELIQYTANFTTVGLSDEHDVDVTLVMANVKKYFRNETKLQPFIGAGLGTVVVDISGPAVSGSSTGVAFQLMGGLEYRMSNIGFFGELKYIDAMSESDNNEKVDVSGTGIFTGITFHF